MKMIQLVCLIPLLSLNFQVEQDENKTVQPPVRIVCAGDFHGDEVDEGIEYLEWYGLVKEEDRYYLKKTGIIVKPRFDAIVDSKGDTTGKSISAEIPGDVIILVSGMKDVREGEVTSVKLKKSFLYPGDHMSLHLNDQWTYFSGYGTAEQGKPIGPYLLQASSTIDRHRMKQTVASTDGFDDTLYRFIWAGDLDRDGRLDLVMDTSDHYNVQSITLFLSSVAGKREVFRKIAEFRTVGC